MEQSYHNFEQQFEQQFEKFKDSISNYEIKEVNLNSILGIKKLSDNITKYEKLVLWKNFSDQYDNIILQFKKLNIPVDSNIKDFKEYPKNIILIMKETIHSTIKIESNKEIESNKNIESNKEIESNKNIESEQLKSTKINELIKLNVDLSREYIKQEDDQEDLQDKTCYLFSSIDEKFEWLDDNEDFIKISDFLEKISEEICNGVIKFIEEKRQFYSDYFEESFKNETNYNSKIYVNNFIKSYLLSNFNDIFNHACLDVLDQNNIKDEEQIKQIIDLYYDHTKDSTKIMLTLTDIDHQINSDEKCLPATDTIPSE